MQIEIMYIKIKYYLYFRLITLEVEELEEEGEQLTFVTILPYGISIKLFYKAVRRPNI